MSTVVCRWCPSLAGWAESPTQGLEEIIQLVYYSEYFTDGQSLACPRAVSFSAAYQEDNAGEDWQQQRFTTESDGFVTEAGMADAKALAAIIRLTGDNLRRV